MPSPLFFKMDTVLLDIIVTAKSGLPSLSKSAEIAALGLPLARQSIRELKSIPALEEVDSKTSQRLTEATIVFIFPHTQCDFLAS